jgi:hypothetical protein
MVHPHQPTALSALDLPLISSHEPTCHWSPVESENRMMCNLNSGEGDETKELYIHLHKLLHSLFFSVTHCTVLPFFHHIYIFLKLVFKISGFTKEQGNVISFQTFCERNNLEDKKSKALKIMKHVSQPTCVPTYEGNSLTSISSANTVLLYRHSPVMRSWGLAK